MTIPCANPLVSPDPVGPGLPAGAALPAATAGRKSSVPAACGGRSRRRRRAGALALGVLLAAGAMAAERFPITPAQRDEADKIARQGVAIADLAPNAPASYTIKRGDTLWGISSLFLKSPWRWPELWGMNRTQIHNPHLIYPGQTLLLVKTADGRAQLVLAGSAPPAPEAPVAAPAVAPTPPPPPTEKLSPRARDMGSAAEVMAISSIPNNQIEPFLSRPKVVTPEELAGFPRIVATQQDRVYLGAGDIAYARGIDSAAHDGAENFHVFRPASALYDPDDYDRKAPIAYEALYLGTAKLLKGGEVGTLTIIESKQEIGVGDRLVPITHQELINYVPHRPERDIAGRIVAVYGGVDTVGAGSIVTLNRGRRDGLDIGSVLAVMSNGQTIVDRTAANHEKVKLPDENIGHLFVFRIFDNISYALLVAASGPVAVGDRFTQPDAPPAATGAAAAGTVTAPSAMP